jgi:hypothetical protein
MEARLMILRCDHCRGNLGLIIHRYWRMRFCSAACRQAYQQRLHGETKAKIHLLNGTSGEDPPQRGLRFPAGFGRNFAA